ncbi:MAG: hypothetical protein KJ907_10895 [Actinobacteria bacterium]|nr:hypothetical protein [Actinomycetota bacterium]MBU4403223.1 hypothetical protein [Actinomycetota bacterium]
MSGARMSARDAALLGAVGSLERLAEAAGDRLEILGSDPSDTEWDLLARVRTVVGESPGDLRVIDEVPIRVIITEAFLEGPGKPLVIVPTEVFNPNVFKSNGAVCKEITDRGSQTLGAFVASCIRTLTTEEVDMNDLANSSANDLGALRELLGTPDSFPDPLEPWQARKESVRILGDYVEAGEECSGVRIL